MSRIKRLMVNSEPTHIIFDMDSSDENIEDWIKKNLSRFDLNEEFSCSVFRTDHAIQISGDEDFMEILIERVQILSV